MFKKEVDHLDGEYIDWKIEEKFQVIAPEWKEDIKKDVFKGLQKEMNEKFEELKRLYDDKFASSFLDEDIMDIGGHGQNPASEQN